MCALPAFEGQEIAQIDGQNLMAQQGSKIERHSHIVERRKRLEWELSLR